MTKEDKELLLKDLCTRLPYGLKVYNTTFKEPAIQTLYGKISEDEFLMEETYTNVGIDGDDLGSFNKRHYTGYVDFIKPYLRSVSSMTEVEYEDYISFDAYTHLTDGTEVPGMSQIDWFNTHHFDYRGLIEKGIALVAPSDMYK